MGSEDQDRDGKGPAEGPGCAPDGAAAASGDEPRTVSQCGNSEPGAAGSAGREGNEELKWAREHVRDGTARQPAPHLPRPPSRWKISEKQLKKRPLHHKPGPAQPEQAVFRKTELHTRPPLAAGLEVSGITRRDLPGAEEIAGLFRSGSPEWIHLLLQRQDAVADDLYRQVAKAEYHLETLDERLGQVTGRLDRRVGDLEERGRYR